MAHLHPWSIKYILCLNAACGVANFFPGYTTTSIEKCISMLNYLSARGFIRMELIGTDHAAFESVKFGYQAVPVYRLIPCSSSCWVIPMPAS